MWVRCVVGAMMMGLGGTHVGEAQTVAERWNERTMEFAGALGRISDSAGDDRTYGLTAQVSRRRNTWLRYGAQGGVDGPLDVAFACDAVAGNSCDLPPGRQWFVTPLLGAGVRNRSVEVRAFAGPRLLLSGADSRVGAQFSADVSVGNQRGALFFPVAWSWQAYGGRTLARRTVGVGLQFR